MCQVHHERHVSERVTQVHKLYKHDKTPFQYLSHILQKPTLTPNFTTTTAPQYYCCASSIFASSSSLATSAAASSSCFNSASAEILLSVASLTRAIFLAEPTSVPLDAPLVAEGEVSCSPASNFASSFSTLAMFYTVKYQYSSRHNFRGKNLRPWSSHPGLFASG